MMEQAANNRVENDLEKWLKREQRLRKIFLFPMTNRIFLREKLKYYRSLEEKYRGRASLEEQRTIRMMKDDRKTILKQLYPNAFVRLSYKLFSETRNSLRFYKEQQRKEASFLSIMENIRRLGFPQNALSREKLEALYKNPKEHNIFSYQTKENEQMKFSWDISREQNGQLKLEGYHAMLTKNGKSYAHKFDIHHGQNISATQAYNLLSGRSVEIGTGDNRHWINFDLTDKGRNDKYKVRRYYSNSYSYSLEKVLNRLPLKYPVKSEQYKALYAALRRGERKGVTLSNGRLISIEANPHHKCLNFYLNDRKVTYAQAVNGRKPNKEIPLKGRLRKGFEGNDRKKIKKGI